MKIFKKTVAADEKMSFRLWELLKILFLLSLCVSSHRYLLTKVIVLVLSREKEWILIGVLDYV